MCAYEIFSLLVACLLNRYACQNRCAGAQLRLAFLPVDLDDLTDPGTDPGIQAWGMGCIRGALGAPACLSAEIRNQEPLCYVSHIAHLIIKLLELFVS